MEITIREAKEKDCIRLMELIHELAVFERAPHEVSVSLEEFIDAGFGKNPVWKAFVGEVNGRVEGFALYYIRYSTWKGCRIYLEDLLVTESMRSKGIGRKLFDRVLMEAKEKGFNGVTWQVLDWNEPAIDFYKKYDSSIDPEWLNGSLSKEQIAVFAGSIK